MSNILEEPIQRVVCRVIGHRYDPKAAFYYGIYDCDRCGSPHGDEPGLLRRACWRLSWWCSGRWQDLRHWWRCPDCGARMGAPHSDNCLPF